MLTTISDRKTPNNTTIGAAVTYYKPVIITANDYYPFGMLMPGRNYSSTANKYRYGFNGQERSTEINTDGNSMTAEFWQYDARLGRRWNVDPVLKQWESPYLCFSGSPIWLFDPYGNDPGYDWEYTRRWSDFHIAALRVAFDGLKARKNANDQKGDWSWNKTSTYVAVSVAMASVHKLSDDLTKHGYSQAQFMQQVAVYSALVQESANFDSKRTYNYMQSKLADASSANRKDRLYYNTIIINHDIADETGDELLGYINMQARLCNFIVKSGTECLLFLTGASINTLADQGLQYIKSSAFKGTTIQADIVAASGRVELTSGKFGKIIGWGESQSVEAVQQTINVTKNLTASQVQGWANQGLTKSWVQDQLTKYSNSLMKGGDKLKNTQLTHRKELMEKILKLW